MYVNKLSGLCYSYVVDNEVKTWCTFSRKNNSNSKLVHILTDPFSNTVHVDIIYK